MSEWREVDLGQFLEVHHGFAFKGENFRPSGDLVVLTPGNFFDEGGFKPKGGAEKYYDGPFPPQFLLSQGDVVVAMTEQVQGLLGSTATIPEDGVYLHNQRIGRLEVTDPNNLSLRFVYHLMNVPGVRSQLQATATGAKIRHTAPGRIKQVRAAVPGLATQDKVAAVLDQLDELIGNTGRRVKVLENMAWAIYREWFVNFRYPGYQNATFIESALGPIPAGWEVGTLADLATEVRQSAKPSVQTSILPYVPIDVIDPRTITLQRFRSGEDAASSLRLFSQGDVLFGAMRAYFHKVCVAPFDGVTRSTCFVLRPMTDRREFAVMTLADDKTVAYASAHSSGSTIPYAKWAGVLSAMPSLLPPTGLAKAFGDLVSPLLEEARCLAPQIRTLGGLRDLLLPRLVTGQVDVSSLELDALVEGTIA